ncbi:MAG: hypothetical protein ABI575_05965 [Oxalobacteraceae bacterium]
MNDAKFEEMPSAQKCICINYSAQYRQILLPYTQNIYASNGHAEATSSAKVAQPGLLQAAYAR